MAGAIVVLAIAVAGVAAALLIGKQAKVPKASAAAKPAQHVNSVVSSASSPAAKPARHNISVASPPASSPATVTVTTAATTPTLSSAQPTGFAVSSGPNYTVSYPSGWSTQEDNAQQSYNPTATASKFVEPSDPDVYVLVAETADSSTSAEFDAMQQRNASVAESGYDELFLGPVNTPGATAWQWEFRQDGNQKVDTFWNDCGHGFAVLGSAPIGVWSTYSRTFAHVTNSFRATPC